MQMGAGCSGATILYDDGYPNCIELNVADLLMYSSNQGVCNGLLGSAVESAKGNEGSDAPYCPKQSARKCLPPSSKPKTSKEKSCASCRSIIL